MVTFVQWAILMWNFGMLFSEVLAGLNPSKTIAFPRLHSDKPTDSATERDRTLPIVCRCVFIIALGIAGCFSHIFS